MRNPLSRRIPRLLRSEFGKYLAVFLFLVGTIGFISGFLVADVSMTKAYQESFEKYNIEDGNFELSKEAGAGLLAALELSELSVYENNYVEEASVNQSTLRIYANRKKVDLVCLMSGALPQRADEIAVDRMYARNNGIAVGETIPVGERQMVVTGLVALSDYSALFSQNTDMMFDAIKFGVAVTTKEGFEAFGDTHLHYSYSWKYNQKPENTAQAKRMGDRFLESLVTHVYLQGFLGRLLGSGMEIRNFVPEYTNQAIHFTGDDMSSDKVMMEVLLYVMIAILAFVFAITISNTISMEARTIGTLRASGYRRGELLKHYLTLPLLVTLIGALVGNILGYTLLKEVCVGLYYNSYSLTNYVTIWNAEAFWKTTLIPVAIMALINFAVLIHRLQLSPLQFLRSDLSKKRHRRAVRLPNIPFFSRFRIRVLLQNRYTYLMVFIGVLFANLLLMFSLVFPAMLGIYEEEILGNMIAGEQYILKEQAETSNPQAEKYGIYSLETLENNYGTKDGVTVYGIQRDSAYVKIDTSREGVYVSEGLLEKYNLRVGDTVTLKENYTDKTYDFQIAGSYHYPAALAVFMDFDRFRTVFDLEKEAFSGYFSNEKLTDLKESDILSVIDAEDLTKLSRQLEVSMGEMMKLVTVFAVLMFVLLIYLLAKIILEKNASSISMAKILGFSDGEIGALYLHSTTGVVMVSILASLPLTYLVLQWIFREMILRMMAGWFTFTVKPELFVQIALIGALSYSVIGWLLYRRIRRIPMEEALKNIE
ncbi:MAG: ABC transporter permease [Eubacteriales bacterium]|nr:ABC transporter permease [Eubacteriales bacterium]